MTDRELMQQALDALNWAVDFIEPRKKYSCDCPVCLASNALRERLAQQAPRSDYRDWDYQDQLDAQEQPDMNRYSEEHCPRCGSGDYVVQHTLYTGIETTYKSCEDCGNHWGHE